MHSPTSEGTGHAAGTAAVDPAAARQPLAVIVVDHGSRRSESNESMEAFVRSSADRMPYPIVEPAHMELAEPSIGTAFDRCVAAGAATVVLAPYFLGPGTHWDRDIPALAAGAAARHPGVRLAGHGPARPPPPAHGHRGPEGRALPGPCGGHGRRVLGVRRYRPVCTEVTGRVRRGVPAPGRRAGRSALAAAVAQPRLLAVQGEEGHGDGVLLGARGVGWAVPRPGAPARPPGRPCSTSSG